MAITFEHRPIHADLAARAPLRIHQNEIAHQPRIHFFVGDDVEEEDLEPALEQRLQSIGVPVGIQKVCQDDGDPCRPAP